MSVQLPDGLLIYFQTDRLWIGGSAEGRYYLLIERSAGENGLPTILSEDDIDLFLCTTSPAKRFNAQTAGASVTGTLSGRWVKGYLTRSQKGPCTAFLVLVIDLQAGNSPDAANVAIEVANRMTINTD